MRVDLYGLTFETPRVTCYLWSPWRASALEHRMFDAVRHIQGLTMEEEGDEVRLRLTRGLGFSREDRDENIRRIAFVARLLARHGVAAITAAISPYRAAREEARREGMAEMSERFRAGGGELYVPVPQPPAAAGQGS